MSLWCVSWRRRGVLGCIISVVWRWRRRGGVIVSRPPGWWTCVVMVHYSSIIEDHSWNKRCKDCKAGVTISTNSREYIKKKKKKNRRTRETEIETETPAQHRYLYIVQDIKKSTAKTENSSTKTVTAARVSVGRRRRRREYWPVARAFERFCSRKGSKAMVETGSYSKDPSDFAATMARGRKSRNRLQPTLKCE